MANGESLDRRAVPPDPHGLLGLAIVGGVLALHLAVPLGPEGRLVSGVWWIEAAAHLWLILGPPAAVYLGFRHWLLGGESPAPLVTVPVAALLTLLTLVGVTMGVLCG